MAGKTYFKPETEGRVTRSSRRLQQATGSIPLTPPASEGSSTKSRPSPKVETASSPLGPVNLSQQVLLHHEDAPKIMLAPSTEGSDEAQLVTPVLRRSARRPQLRESAPVEAPKRREVFKRKLNVAVSNTEKCPPGENLAGEKERASSPPRKKQRTDNPPGNLTESAASSLALRPDIRMIPHDTEPAVSSKKSRTARKNAKVPEEPKILAAEKPATIGQPEIWCDTRQELCESLPSFRAYQGGCYSSKGFTRGYLIDGHASERDYMDGSIIISHAGGNSEEVDGERRLVKDQTWDKGTIAYLRNNRDQMVPLIVIIGERCPTAPGQLQHRYSVMDWFKVSHCWPEKDTKSGNIRCKFRLEKLDTSSRGWWSAADTSCVSDDLVVEYVNCSGCKQDSPYVYDDEPMCLNKDCGRFWLVFNGRNKKAPENFMYRESFLHGKTLWPETAMLPPGPLAPILPVENEHTDSSGRDVKRRFWKGICCPNCSKLNCRELWQGWNCTNCDWRFIPRRSHFIPADLSDPHRPDFTGPPIPENVVDPSVKTESMVFPDGRRAITYHVYQCGKIVHILANKSWNALPMGSDWLLDKYQHVDMPFKRHELKSHKLTGRLLTQQFSFNSGAPYKYIVDVDSLPFENSPDVVRQALGILQTDVTKVFPETEPMNEVLNVAYFEEQKMDFHDDGEVDLGPCVSSISLGSPAMMYFRVKAKYCSGNIAPADKALLVPSNPAGTDPTGLKKQAKRNVLELRLHHGDVIIMNGRSIQRILEHAVTPEGFRIAATARNISTRNIFPNAQEAGKAVPKQQAAPPIIDRDLMPAKKTGLPESVGVQEPPLNIYTLPFPEAYRGFQCASAQSQETMEIPTQSQITQYGAPQASLASGYHVPWTQPAINNELYHSSVYDFGYAGCLTGQSFQQTNGSQQYGPPNMNPMMTHRPRVQMAMQGYVGLLPVKTPQNDRWSAPGERLLNRNVVETQTMQSKDEYKPY